VTNIDLDSNEIGAEGAKEIAEALKKNSSVTTIDLWGNKIGADGAKAIAEALAENSSVTKINLRYNDIGDDGAKEIAEALKKNSSVNDINLSSNAIGADGGMAIAEALAENTSVTYIYLYGNNISRTDEALIISKTASNQILKKHQEDVQKNKNELKEKRRKIREIDDPDGDDSGAYELLDEEIRVLRAKFKILNKSGETNKQPSYPIQQQQYTFPLRYNQQINDRSSNNNSNVSSSGDCLNYPLTCQTSFGVSETGHFFGDV